MIIFFCAALKVVTLSVLRGSEKCFEGKEKGKGHGWLGALCAGAPAWP